MARPVPVRGARTAHAIFTITALARCGCCPAGQLGPCAVSADGTWGFHLARFAAARRSGHITEADMALVLDAAGSVITSSVIIYDDIPAPSRPVRMEAR